MSVTNILLLSPGSKVAITKIARESAFKRGVCLHGIDTTSDIPARHFLDRFHCIRKTEPDPWVDSILDYCQAHSIGLVIPTRHADLFELNANRERFSKANIHLALSANEALKVCLDKCDTYEFLKKRGIATPVTYSRECCNLEELDLSSPHVAKPRFGSGSQGFASIRTKKELSVVPSDWIIQEKALGSEYTINAYVSNTGKLVCAVPHQRIIVDGGEVMQARTERIETLIAATKEIVSQLSGLRGPVNLQAFYLPDSNTCQFIEINPRLGGGFPLAHQAKCHSIEWLCQETLDHKTLEPFDGWTENLLMMRYREAVFENQ